ncbi:MAG: hypothetical protein ACI4UK_08240 [Floccifex sp.]
MIELTIKEIFESNGVSCFFEEQNNLDEYIVISKTNDYSTDGLWTASFDVDIYSDTSYHASLLSEKIKQIILNVDFNNNDSISKIMINSLYENNDLTKKKYRYFCDFDCFYIE